jgi:hypothetical protein
MFKGIRIVHSRLVSLVVLTILTMVIGVSAARAQSAAGTTTPVTGAAEPVVPQDKAVANSGTSLTLESASNLLAADKTIGTPPLGTPGTGDPVPGCKNGKAVGNKHCVESPSE